MVGDRSELVLGLLRPLQFRQSGAVTSPVELFTRAILARLVGACGCRLGSASDGSQAGGDLGENILDVGRRWSGRGHAESDALVVVLGLGPVVLVNEVLYFEQQPIHVPVVVLKLEVQDYREFRELGGVNAVGGRIVLLLLRQRVSSCIAVVLDEFPELGALHD
eukprot:9503264-Pyramimonas_sp.AAC.1